MTVVALWRQMDLSACLGEVDDVLMTGNPGGSLVADRSTFAARRGRNPVDKILYLGHLPGSAEGERK